MNKPIWYGIKGTGPSAKVRLFAQDPSASQDVTDVGQCTLTNDDGNLDVIFDDGTPLFSETVHQSQTQTAGSSSANAA